MTGLEKIIEKINADSAEACKATAAAAEKKVAQILGQAQAKGDEEAAAIEREAQKRCESIEAMARSRAEQVSRQTLLAAKVEAVNNTLARLEATLMGMPANEYFDALLRIAAANAMAGSCTVRLSAKDLARMPADFAERLTCALKAAGSDCKLSAEDANIGGGLILIYGDIEINCSFAAIIEARADELKEEITRLIFD